VVIVAEGKASSRSQATKFGSSSLFDQITPMKPDPEKRPIEPREMTSEEEEAWGPELDLRALSAINRSEFDAALLAPHIGRWVAWSPDSSRMVAHAKDIETLQERVSKAGADPERCPIEFLGE
jgi:hypothetical protein